MAIESANIPDEIIEYKNIQLNKKVQQLLNRKFIVLFHFKPNNSIISQYIEKIKYVIINSKMSKFII